MRIRAGIVLIQEGKVALIERHRARLDYFVFPGGGVDDGESPEQAAAREAREELGIEVDIKQKVVEIQFGQKSRHIYFLAEQKGGEFGTGAGEEYTDADPDRSDEGVYIPIWMPITELVLHQNIYPAEVARLVLKSLQDGWQNADSIFFEDSR